MHLKKTLIFASLLAVSFSAVAATTADLRATGRILPGGCEVTLNGGAAVNLRTISAADLNPDPDAATRLAAVRVPFNITCLRPAIIATSWTDNHEAEGAYQPSAATFSLGQDAAGTPIGNLRITHGPAIPVTGGVSSTAKSLTSTNGIAWDFSITGQIVKTGMIGYGVVGGPNIPAAFQTYGGELVLTPTIAPVNTLDMSSTLNIEASQTIELRYL